MRMREYLEEEWRPALGCTEPACIAYAAATAAAQTSGPVTGVRVTCDPQLYKNCFAVGIPNSGRQVGILWATAIGALLPDPSAKLELFRQIRPETLADAAGLIEQSRVRVAVDAARAGLFVDCIVETAGGSGRAVIEDDHTRITRVERDGSVVLDAGAVADDAAPSVRGRLAELRIADLVELGRRLDPADRTELQRGMELNVAIAEHGAGLLPDRFGERCRGDRLATISRMVCGGVYARMSGEDFVVMSLAGSGNKGITASVPLALWGRELGADPERLEEALAVTCLVTSATTWHLGSLSAMCGTANAAGTGLAVGLVVLEGGGAEEASMAVTNMVGNLAGMICDGAKIGCGLKGMTAVDAAFRASSLALAGMAIPVTDGIVGGSGETSLANLGRIAGPGMESTDGEILSIMGEKLASKPDRGA